MVTASFSDLVAWWGDYPGGERSEMASLSPIGTFNNAPADDNARKLWAKRLGFEQARVSLPLEDSIGGKMLDTARSLPKLGGPEDPGRMLKNWDFYKFRPYNSDLKCGLNKFGPDFRWPGLNNTPAFRHHLALAPRKKPKHPLPEKYWSDMPRLEEGPGHDFVYKRLKADERVEEARMTAFFQQARRSSVVQ